MTTSAIVHRRRVVPIALILTVTIAACTSDAGTTDTTSTGAASFPATTTVDTTSPTVATSAVDTTVAVTTVAPTTAPPSPVRILVTNDDGVDAPGIDELVTRLAELDEFEVTVVAPAEQQSGTGGSLTAGALTTTSTTTASGYPAVAVDGFPADTIVWAIDDGGVAERPDLVISGINEGQNLGPFLDLSGTIGAARAAAIRGIPSIAVSQGLPSPDTPEPDFATGADVVLDYLDANLDALLSNDGTNTGSSAAMVDRVVNLNVPTCSSGSTIRGVAEVVALVSVDDPGTALAAQDCTVSGDQPAGDVDAFAAGFVTVGEIDALPARAAIAERLSRELADPALAAEVVDAVDDGVVSRLAHLAGGALLHHPVLSFDPPTIDADDVDTLWLFSFGYRFAPGVTPPAGGGVPPLDAIEPGPVNAEIAEVAADFLADHPVPVIAQAEIAAALSGLLADAGITEVEVLSVGPEVAADGSVTYLSTAGVVAAGIDLAAGAGITVGRAGIICFADHAPRCVLTAASGGVDAAVPAGVELPSTYDPESGQPWTTNRRDYLVTDLLGRSLLPAGR